MATCSKRSHDDCDPDTCFAAKCAHWRRHGAFQVTYQGGRQNFHENDSLKKQENDHVAELKAAGIEFERAPR